MLGHISQINTQRISIYTFRTIKASSSEYRLVYVILYSPDNALIVRNVYIEIL